jgi:hypothetical protein
MKKYKLRIPALSIFWHFQDAETEEEAFDIIVSKLEKDNPRIAWRDRDIWEIQEVEDPLEELRKSRQRVEEAKKKKGE